MKNSDARELVKLINNVDSHTAARILARIMGSFLSRSETDAAELFENLREEYDDLAQEQT